MMETAFPTPTLHGCREAGRRAVSALFSEREVPAEDPCGLPVGALVGVVSTAESQDRRADRVDGS
jgi:hypothetical protein